MFDPYLSPCGNLSASVIKNQRRGIFVGELLREILHVQFKQNLLLKSSPLNYPQLIQSKNNTRGIE